MHCESCAQEYPADKKFCRRCGDVLVAKEGSTGAPALPSCANCRATVAPEDAFCPSCGAGIGASVAQPATPAAPTPPPPGGVSGAPVDGASARTVRPTPPARGGETLHCPACGATVSVGDHVCELCGASLAGVVPAAPKVAGPSPAPHPPPPAGARTARSAGLTPEEMFAVEQAVQQRRSARRRSILLGGATAIIVALGLAIGGGALRTTTTGSGPAAPAPTVPVRVVPGGNVAIADELGIRIVGAGAGNSQRSTETIRKIVEGHLGELAKPYDDLVKGGETSEGAVILHMTVAADGHVVYVRPTPAGLDSLPLLRSIQQAVGAWKLPPIASGLTSIHYPLVFYRRGTDPHDLVARMAASSVETSGGELAPED
ncbi:MAG: Double zinc ribbon [Candidatus Binatota bacterium]|jgi:hypothetical protein|nr:Double zinc ribbon [Candidatus Binatota bacterium]